MVCENSSPTATSTVGNSTNSAQRRPTALKNAQQYPTAPVKVAGTIVKVVGSVVEVAGGTVEVADTILKVVGNIVKVVGTLLAPL